jgi:hypothetical protein
MRTRTSVCAAFLLMCGALIGCSSTSSNSTPPPPPPITGSLSGAPQSLAADATASITATVVGDSTNAGVDWSCTPAAACGSFNPAHTASGAATTYTAPGTAGSVTITATSTASGKAIATATISITGAPAVALSLAPPPATLTTNGTTSLTATVTNDSTNAGVDWTCTPAGTCGTFNPAHTASGTATSYTAPGAAGSVTVIATATASSSATQSATITITAANSVANLKGSYAFALLGRDAGTHPYSLAGSVALDGNGNVTAGEQDYNNAEGTASPEPGGDTITGGTYTVNPNGVGTLTLVTNNTALGTTGTEHFSLTVVNNNHALLTQLDASGTAGGTLDFQTIAVGLGQVNGTYSFTMTGATDNNPEVFGGTITSSGTGTLSVIVDSNENGTVTIHGTNTGTYIAPDAMGRGTLSFGGDTFVYYVIGPEALKLVVVGLGETDLGSAFGQGTGTGSFSNASLKGSFVYRNSSAETGAASYASAGMLTTDGNGNITSGFGDLDDAGTVKSNAFAGTYTMASNGYGSATVTGTIAGTFGVYAIDPALNPLDPNNTASGGGMALILELDSTATGGGVLLAQASSPTFEGNYAVDYRGFTPAGVEQNLEGQIVVSGTGIAGAGDANGLPTPGETLGASITGTLTADPLHAGRFTLPLTIGIGATPPVLTFVIYQASTGDLFWVETDTTQYVSGTIEQQPQ